MKQCAHLRSVFVVALLFGGGATPLIGWTHWEGIEAADPATPAALLAFDSAVARYTAFDGEARSWRARFDSDTGTVGSLTDTSSHSNHTGATPGSSAKMQR